MTRTLIQISRPTCNPCNVMKRVIEKDKAMLVGQYDFTYIYIDISDEPIESPEILRHLVEKQYKALPIIIGYDEKGEINLSCSGFTKETIPQVLGWIREDEGVKIESLSRPSVLRVVREEDMNGSGEEE